MVDEWTDWCLDAIERDNLDGECYKAVFETLDRQLGTFRAL